MSLAALGRKFSSAVQLEGEVRSRFDEDWSRGRGEGCPASCSSSCPRFRFRESFDGSWRTCRNCNASIRSVLWHGRRGKERDSLSCLQGRCLLEGREVPVFLDYDDFWTKIACEIVILLVDVDFCERLAAS